MNSAKRSKISYSSTIKYTDTNVILQPNKDANWIPGIASQTVINAPELPSTNPIDASMLCPLVSTLTNTSRSTSSASQSKQPNTTNGKQSNTLHNDNNSDSDDFDENSDEDNEDESTPPKKPSFAAKAPESSPTTLASIAHQMVDCLHECVKQQRAPTFQTVEAFMGQLKPWIPLVFTHNSNGNSRVKPKSKPTDSVPYYTVTIPIQALPSNPPKIKTEFPLPVPAIQTPPLPSQTTATAIERLVPSTTNETELSIPKLQEKELSSPSLTPPLPEPQFKKRGRKSKQEQQVPSKPLDLEIKPPIVSVPPPIEQPRPQPVVQTPASPPIPKVSINPPVDPKRRIPRYQWLGEPITEDGFGFAALQFEGVVYCLGDCVHMESGDDDFPFIGLIVALVQKGSKKFVGTTWFYRANDIPIFTAKDIAKVPKNELFTCTDYNENTVNMIVKKCTVKHVSQIRNLEEYSRRPNCYYYQKSWNPENETIATVDQPLDGINMEDKSSSFGKRLGSETIAPPAKIPKLVSVNHSMAVIEAFMKENAGRSAEPAEETPSKMEEEEQAPVKKKEVKKESPRPQADFPPSTPQSEAGIPILENLIPEFPQIVKRKPQPKKSAKPPSKTQSPPKRSVSRPPQPLPQPQQDIEPMLPAPDYDDTPAFVPASPPPSSQASQKERKGTMRTLSASIPSLWKEVNSSEDYNNIVAAAGTDKLIVREYYAVWCSPCIRARPKMEKLAESFSNRDVIFIRTDVDEGEDPGILNTSVKNLPTYTLVVGGKIVASVVGTDEVQLTQSVENHLLQLTK